MNLRSYGFEKRNLADFGQSKNDHEMASRKSEIALANRGWTRAIANEERDFTFAVGSREYQWRRIAAAFLSERVSALQANDCTVDRLGAKDLLDAAAHRGEFFKCFRSSPALQLTFEC
jgi:hypothetical protein